MSDPDESPNDGPGDDPGDGPGDDPGDGPTAAAVREAAREFERAGRPFARVTVVRREGPVSANVGDRALVTREGDLVGWIGGAECAQSVVVREATAAIDSGEPVLLGLAPDPADVDRPGVEAFPMTCHSGGTLELFVEPVTPGPRLVVVGDSPVARAVARLGSEVAATVTVVTPDDIESGGAAVDDQPGNADQFAGADAVVVASMGEVDEAGLAAALRADPAYVGLVASDRRRDEVARAVAERLGLAPETVTAAVTTPAGLDINARGPEEIAVSVLAELVALRRDAEGPIPVETGDPSVVGAAERSEGDGVADGIDEGTADRADDDEAADESGTATAVDPVCGMDVAVDAETPTVEHAGTRYRFCGQGCADAFADDPARYVEEVSTDD